MFSPSWQAKLEAELRAQKYSPRTIASYIYHNRDLCRRLQKPPEKITAEDIKGYLAHQNKHRNLSASTRNLALSAFKFFYNRMMEREIVQEQHRPRQDKRLPVVLSKQEINAVLKAEENLKHRLLLMMVYSSGLRVSEVVSLKRSDIDPSRKTLFVGSGKGGKDRYTLLSDQVIQALKKYYFFYDIKT
jgi:site-specific recombinase XerD